MTMCTTPAGRSIFSLTVPAELKSGLYAARLRSGDEEDYIPFVVKPAKGKEKKLAFLLPTASYMAYANEHMATNAGLIELLSGRLAPLDKNSLFLNEHREYGGSCYDSHSDGSGVCYSSRLRPILNMRPKHMSALGGDGSSLWQFNADTHITDWLEAQGYDFDVITDEDLHYEGLALLKPYRVILSGTPSRVPLPPDVGRDEGLSESGRAADVYGGQRLVLADCLSSRLPRSHGGAAQRGAVFGPGPRSRASTTTASPVNTAACGAIRAALPRSCWARGSAPRALIFQRPITACRAVSRTGRPLFLSGIGKDEVIGDFGLIGGGAAGLEIDRADERLGTPPHALVLATSKGGHTDVYLVVCEELLATVPGLGGTENELVRADMVFYETPNGGAVWSSRLDCLGRQSVTP